ncbi:glycoside hydrolase family 43 protein [Amphibacillus jilinensis]|uniref:glycoside hydrolase family 43 protein n=1 Tax=Amphibacillus jilinensis TaxID=1216008 RepID=UPI0002FF1C0A|nr:glycoside hydrolase family 43 protein [Amphibacillus jilinensis]
MKYLNPVISGFYPDPSITKVGENDYYLVNSSFEYYPGIPIHHSTDLINWTQIGHVLSKENKFDLTTAKSSGGIYAPTIRYHNGNFYVITTNVSGGGNFYVTATDPAGPWSDPIKIPYGNIDPSIMFDDDGTVYITTQNGAGYDSHIIQYEIDINTGQALTEPVTIFCGDGDQWVEGPHLYHIGDTYYLLCASGGTGDGHKAIMAKSDKPYGPYELCPYPILTHKSLPDHPIQCIGHADLINDHNNNWWVVFLGTRPVNNKYTLMGRETFLAPVKWDREGWIEAIDNNSGHVNTVMESNHLTTTNYQEQVKTIYTFDDASLTEWFYLRAKKEEKYSLTDRKGWLKLTSSADALHDRLGIPTFICKPQQHINMSFSTLIDFTPNKQTDEAGIAVRLDEASHLKLAIRQINNRSTIVATCCYQGEANIIADHLIEDNEIELRISCDDTNYTFQFKSTDGEWITLGKISIKYLSNQLNGGAGGSFTGVCIGLYATTNGEEQAIDAYYNWVKYEGKENL